MHQYPSFLNGSNMLWKSKWMRGIDALAVDFTRLMEDSLWGSLTENQHHLKSRKTVS